MDDMLIDLSTLSTTDKLCFMILDHLKRAEDEFDNFKSEYMDAKRLEKFNEVMKYVWNFLDNEDSEKYHVTKEYSDDVMVFMCHGEWNQLAVSICIKRLSIERIKSIWVKLFPNHDIETLLHLWEEDGNYESEHIIYGYDHDDPKESLLIESMKKYEYSEEDVKRVLKEMTLTELVNIIPEITAITYKNVPV
jgi:hypothetical protein